MTKKNILSKRMGHHTTGEMNARPDERICYDAMEHDWKDHIVFFKEDGKFNPSSPYVPFDKVEQIMVENEQLRESLYAQQNTHYNRVISTLQQEMIGQSTSNVIKLTDEIHNITNGVIQARDSFMFVYSAIELSYGVQFNRRRARESKLQYCWRIGYLPHVALLMKALLTVIHSMWVTDRSGTTRYFKTLSTIIDARNKKMAASVKKP